MSKLANDSIADPPEAEAFPAAEGGGCGGCGLGGCGETAAGEGAETDDGAAGIPKGSVAGAGGAAGAAGAAAGGADSSASSWELVEPVVGLEKDDRNTKLFN